MIIADSWKDVEEGIWRWPNFSPEEMACRGTGSLRLDEDFMDRLQGLRDIVQMPLPVTSGYRSPEHDAAIRGAGVHPTGLAADIRCFGPAAKRILEIAPKMFTGIGIHQKNSHSGRFIHLDMLPEDDPGHPRPWIWTY